MTGLRREFEKEEGRDDNLKVSGTAFLRTFLQPTASRMLGFPSNPPLTKPCLDIFISSQENPKKEQSLQSYFCDFSPVFMKKEVESSAKGSITLES